MSEPAEPMNGVMWTASDANIAWLEHLSCVVCHKRAIRFSDNNFPVCFLHRDASDRHTDWEGTTFPDGGPLGDIYPFTDEQIVRIARTEPTLRDMLDAIVL